MGNHYVPQEYLRGFETSESSRHVWMFDRKSREWAYAAIKQVAQERAYYSPGIESQLARQIESPGHAALRKVRAGDPIDAADRAALAHYIAVLAMRGPRKRRKGKELALRLFPELLGGLRDGLKQIEATEPHLSIAPVTAELDRIEAAHKNDPAAMIRNEVEKPWATERIVRAIHSMVWRFMRAPPGEFFVTSDNPVHYFDGYGLDTPEAEMIVAISRDIVLFGSRQGPSGTTLLITTSRQLFKEANRRAISAVERFLFSSRRADWIEKIEARSKPRLSGILW